MRIGVNVDVIGGKYWDWENFESNLQEFRKWKDPEYVELETNETALEDDMQVK